MTDTSRELLSQYQVGAENAADRIFSRYVHRLTALARLRLSERLARRVDPEDIVMSAYRSFFVAARDGRFELHRGGDLWRLLVSITMHKLLNQVASHKAQKRSINVEKSDEGLQFVPSRDPTPEEVLLASDELEAVLAQLPELGRRVLELRLQGETVECIAKETSRNERTVRRMLDLARQAFERRLHKPVVPPVSVVSACEKRLVLPKTVATEPSIPRDGDKSGWMPPQGSSIPLEPTISYGDLLLQQFIGAGGTGKVYRAHWRSVDRNVAVKFLKKSFHQNTHIVQRFLSEATTIARLDHPGIVRLQGLGLSRPMSYFVVMDWLPAGDLHRQMQHGPIAIVDAVRWVRDTALAIQYAHDQGIVHCDLKPGNLLLDERGHAVVTDFGLARTAASIVEEPDRLEGTAGFMSIEQAAPGFSQIGPRTDVYGLGAVLYALLTGHPPYTGSRPSDVLSQLISNCPVPKPSSEREGVPAEIDELCMECLSRDPARRPETAAIVAERLCHLS